LAFPSFPLSYPHFALNLKYTPVIKEFDTTIELMYTLSTRYCTF
jgi:hypothetical protein